jgi:hypothetical protein
MSVSGRSLPPSPATYIFAQNHVPYVTVWAKPSMSLYRLYRLLKNSRALDFSE